MSTDKYRANKIGDVWYVTNPDGVVINEFTGENAEYCARDLARRQNDAQGIQN